MKLLKLQISWAKTEAQVFGGLPKETEIYVHASGEYTDIKEIFRYLGSVFSEQKQGSAGSLTAD